MYPYTYSSFTTVKIFQKQINDKVQKHIKDIVKGLL